MQVSYATPPRLRIISNNLALAEILVVYNYLYTAYNMSAASSQNSKQAETKAVPVAANEAPRYLPEQDLYVGHEPARPFKRRSREYWVTVFSIAALLAFILFLAEGVMPVILIIALMFLYYVLSTVPPEQIEYRITNKGVKIADKTTLWSQLTRFWFNQRMDSELLVFGSLAFPGRIELVIQRGDIEKVKAILIKYLPEEKPEETSVDRAVSWVSKRLPQN